MSIYLMCRNNKYLRKPTMVYLYLHQKNGVFSLAIFMFFICAVLTHNNTQKCFRVTLFSLKIDIQHKNKYNTTKRLVF